MNDNIPYTLGGLFASYVIIPFIIFGIGYGIFRLIKRRKPTQKEKLTLIAIALGLAILLKAAVTARRSSGL